MTADIGGYGLEIELGRGATGAVYRATRKSDGLVAAVKVLDPGLAEDDAYIARFDAEADAMALVAHPGCVSVYQHGREPGCAWIAMEYVDGASLRTVLDAYRRLSAPQACGVLAGALAGLGHAHRVGVVHRDVKPENLLADRAGNSKLADFGLTAPRTNETEEWTPLEGSPAYMSPEQVRGESLDGRSDVYSAAAVLYELITGHPPYTGENPYALMRAQVEAPIPDSRDLPPRIADLIRRAMSKDPAQRPPTAEQFAAELDQAAHRDLGAGWFAAAGIAGLVAGAATGTAVAEASPGKPDASREPARSGSRRARRLTRARHLGRATTLKIAGGITAAVVVTGASAVAATHTSSHASSKPATSTVATTTPSTVRSVSLAVIPCTFSGSTNDGQSVTDSVPPAGSLASHLTVTLPAPLAAEAAVYGATATDVSNQTTYLLAPVGLQCQQFLAANGGNSSNISVSPPGSTSNSAAEVDVTLVAGGLGPSIDFACPYFAAAKAAANQFGFADQCSPPPGQQTRFLAITVVAFQRHSGGAGPTDGVIISRGISGIGEDCTLPTTKAALCEASLALFLNGHGAPGAAGLAGLPWFAST